MKKLLMIAIALFTMASCAVVDKNMVATEYSQTSDSGNIADKLVSLINGYTDKINAVESVYDLFLISEKCYKEKMSFEKNYAEDIATLRVLSQRRKLSKTRWTSLRKRSTKKPRR